MYKFPKKQRRYMGGHGTYERVKDREETRTSPKGPTATHTQKVLSDDSGSMPVKGERDETCHSMYWRCIDHT